ncbi:twin-arginine translocation pathway signal protein [Formosa sp. S-31]|uniref:twin-arginine translocation pathway signal protein n=1 Tax=Formosa sp. S-31 TaxID=2790949 RepID=UPI003EB6A3C3
MKRRTYIKTITLGSLLPLVNSAFGFINTAHHLNKTTNNVSFKSNWHNWPDMKWAGPEYWGNRLQDWEINKRKLICSVTGFNRTLHALTLQNRTNNTPLHISTIITKLNANIDYIETGCVGIILGAKGKFSDFRSAAVFGKGFEVGLTPQGQLKIGDIYINTGLNRIPDSFKLDFNTAITNSSTSAVVQIINPITNSLIYETKPVSLDNLDLRGNFALLASFGKTQKTDAEQPSISFQHWKISSPSLFQKEDNVYGPICFAQYTLHRKKLKLTAQLAPIEHIKNHKVLLEFKRNDQWIIEEETKVIHSGRAINFKIDNWTTESDIPYRISVEIPVGNNINKYNYEGTIAAEPKNNDQLKVAVFSCNAHFGFPDTDIPESLNKLEYDMSVFLGDQFYESTGGFGAQYSGNFDKQCLDYLRKWMMFGWSYREIFRHKPCAIIPDDHDVYHGNIWGSGGELADTSEGFYASAQDKGGYKMSPEWVNMVQFTQTSHLPDAFDPTPVKNNIGVYYTQWHYAGISFAILEDRKFKSAPKSVLPKEAQVYNGFIRNKDFDIKQYKNLKAELLGVRQEKFLEHWVEDWSDDTQMKAVLSQTNFTTVATLPKGTLTDDIVPSLEIPERGQYISGDAPTVDMDSNGWPSNKRDKAVNIISKAMAFHIAGDQHLGSFIQYGLDDYEQGSYAFAGPALNNIWPRRFWPEVNSTNHTVETPAYTGNHIDGFGNKFTLHAVGNPYNRHQEPEILYNRANGFGLVTFDKKYRTIKTDCYERFKDVLQQDAQYPGWPISVRQEDNLLKHANFYLPVLKLLNFKQLPLLKVYQNDQLVYAQRIPEAIYQPKAKFKGSYQIIIVHTETGKSKDYGTHKALNKSLQQRTINISQ